MTESGSSPMVTMTCMTKKKTFEVGEADCPVVVLKNGRYAYRCECPWRGKPTDEEPEGRKLTAFKFCSSEAYKRQVERQS